MKKICIIALREWKHFFQTPFAMIILPIFLVLCGTYFNTAVETYMALSNPTETTTKVSGVTVNTHLLLPFFKDIINLILFITPLMTMRSFAEEKKMGTYDLLISYPVRPWEILLGKYLGNVTMVLALLALTVAFPVYIAFKGQPYVPQIFTTYLGYALFLLLYVALGIMASIMTENQIVAAIITYMGLLGAVIFQWLTFVSVAPWDRFFQHFLLVAHLETFRRGQVFLGDIVAYLGITLCLLMVSWSKIRRHFVR